MFRQCDQPYEQSTSTWAEQMKTQNIDCVLLIAILGVNTKKQNLKTLYRHSDHTHLPLVVLEEIKSIFRDISNPILLAKCAHGGTKNISESLNHVIWCQIPKNMFARLNTLKLGVYDAISSYNKGNVSKCLIFKLMGLTPGKNCEEGMKLLDARRIRRAEKAIEEVQKNLGNKLV